LRGLSVGESASGGALLRLGLTGLMSWCALEASAAPVNNTSDARWRALRLARGLLLPGA